MIQMGRMLQVCTGGLARRGVGAHGREVLGVAQVEGAARRRRLQRRAQLLRALRLCNTA